MKVSGKAPEGGWYHYPEESSRLVKIHWNGRLNEQDSVAIAEEISQKDEGRDLAVRQHQRPTVDCCRGRVVAGALLRKLG